MNMLDFMTEDELSSYIRLLHSENLYFKDRIRFIKHWANLGLSGKQPNEDVLKVILEG